MEIRVLLVDDHKIVRDGLKELLERDPDIRVAACAGTARDGLTKACGAAVEVAIVDLSLPDEDGFWLLERIRHERPDLPVIIFSMYRDESTVVKVLEAGASGYLTKTADAQEVATAIKSVRAGGSYIQSDVAPYVLAALRKKVNGDGHGLQLDERDMEILRGVGLGHSNQKIAEDLFVSLSTIKSQLRSVFRKLSVSTRTEAVLEAMRLGLIDPPRTN